MLTATCMFRSYILLSTRQETPKLLKSYTCSLRLHLMHLISIISFKLGHVSIPKRRSLSPLCLFCAYYSSVLQNFKISSLFFFLYSFFFRILSKLMFLYIVILCIFNSMLLYTYYIISLRMLIHIVNYWIREKTS